MTINPCDKPKGWTDSELHDIELMLSDDGDDSAAAPVLQEPVLSDYIPRFRVMTWGAV